MFPCYFSTTHMSITPEHCLISLWCSRHWFLLSVGCHHNSISVVMYNFIPIFYAHCSQILCNSINPSHSGSRPFTLRFPCENRFQCFPFSSLLKIRPNRRLLWPIIQLRVVTGPVTTAVPAISCHYTSFASYVEYSVTAYFQTSLFYLYNLNSPSTVVLATV